MKNISTIVACATIALGLSGCDVEVKDKGRAPDVDVKIVDKGKLPEYDIVKREDGRIPEVDIEVKDKGKLPKVKVALPDLKTVLKDETEDEASIAEKEKESPKTPVAGVDSKVGESTPKVSEHNNPKVGGAEMKADQPIAVNASKAPNLTTLVAALKAADLVDTLSGGGPFTVFAPTNRAFEALPEGTVDSLLKPENKEKLKSILLYHVVSAKATSSDVTKAIGESNGAYEVESLSGDFLNLELRNGKLVVVDEKGGNAVVDIADVMQSNGVVHVIDSVLMPDSSEVTVN